MKLREDLVGKKFGRWEVIERSVDYKNGEPQWLCVCDCGTKRIKRSSQLRASKYLSCGCYQKEVIIKRLTKHGAAKDGDVTPEYRSWKHMRTRCTNIEYDQYEDYGGRGIKVCDRWLHSFENFFTDMGKRPSLLHTLERKDNDGNYEPPNCYWGTKAEQSRNKRSNHYIEYNGERMVLRDWSYKIGVHETTILYHLKIGKAFEQIVEHFKNKKIAA